MDLTKVERTITVCELGQEEPDWVYWRTRTPQERLQAIEFLRQQFYNYDPISDRLQRVLEVVERSFR